MVPKLHPKEQVRFKLVLIFVVALVVLGIILSIFVVCFLDPSPARGETAIYSRMSRDGIAVRRI